MVFTLEETHMEPDNHWAVEENRLPEVHAIRFHMNLPRRGVLAVSQPVHACPIWILLLTRVASPFEEYRADPFDA